MNKTARVYLAALLFSLLAATLLGKATFYVKGAEFLVSLQLNQQGVTEIVIPPLGSISATTHSTPVKIRTELRNIDVGKLKQIIQQAPAAEQVVDEIRQELKGFLYYYLALLLILSMLGGMTGALVVERVAGVAGRRVKTALQGGVAGLVMGLALLGFTIGTYRPEEFKNPAYQGALQSAPWAIGLAENAFSQVNRLGEQLQIIATNLYTIYERLDTINPVVEKEDDLLVLHVSDIHNNPAAHKFLQQVVKTFPLDFIIDSGDMTDYGTPLETQLLKGLKDLQIPYLFVPGNHDSPEVIKELSQYPQVQVLTGGIVDIQGLRILAMADPSSASMIIAPSDREVVTKAQEKLQELWQEAIQKPHLLVVHNFNLAESLVGMVPVILYGHSHQYDIWTEKGSVLVNAGTTGGAGIRGLQATKEIPYSMVLLHFTRDEQGSPRLTATDTIKLYNLDRGFTLERKLFPLEISSSPISSSN